MKEHVSFAEQMKYERKKHGWSQEDVANKIGCDPKTINRWESGKSLPRTYNRQKISELFGKDLEAFNLVPEAVDGATAFPTPQIMNHQPLLPDVPGSENISLPRKQIIGPVTHSLPGDPSSPAIRYHSMQGWPPPTHPRVIQQRTQTVKAIYMKLIQPDVTALVLTGIGGVGKSTLAALVYRYVLERYQASPELFTAKPGIADI